MKIRFPSFCPLRISIVCLALALLQSVSPLHAKEKDKEKDKAKDKDKEEDTAKKTEEVKAFFEKGPIPSLKIEVEAENVKHLMAAPKDYVKCKITEDGKTIYTDVGIKLKGSAGSFQQFDQRPAFTINMDKFESEQQFHGLDKLHLNNSVQDESCLNELLCGELFRRAGVPAPRVSHARVWVNGRDLGLYVLKEGVDKSFLKRNFGNAKGNLYDGGFCQDIDSNLERDEGKGNDDRKDLAALALACRTGNGEERWAKMEAVLNVDAFISFMAMELMTYHWDGYCMNRNNYRLYFDPSDKDRAHFLPHGMDQMFTDPGASILHQPVGMVAAAVMQNPVWRSKYRERVRALLPLFDPVAPLAKIVADAEARLHPVLEAMGKDALKSHEGHARDILGRLTARAENLRQQSDTPEPKPLEFDAKGAARLGGWAARQESGESGHEDMAAEGKQPRQLRIDSAGDGGTVASWRTSVILEAGTYHFVAKARSKDLKAMTDEKGMGAGLRISGANRTNQLSGTTKWTDLSFEFTTEGQSQVDLVAELRASKGQVWFDADSMRLVRMGKDK